MNESKLRQLVREEVHKLFREHGLLGEGVKKGNKVSTPHGDGIVLSIAGGTARVQLTSGAQIKVHRDRCVVKG